MPRSIQPRYIWLVAIHLSVLVLILTGLIVLSDPVLASQTEKLTGDSVAPSLAVSQIISPTGVTSDLACRLCHSDSEQELSFPSGEQLPVQVDLDRLADSAHGRSAETPLTCTACHRPIDDYQYPHQPVETADLRSYAIERSATCENCHQQAHLTSHPGLETENPVVCTDCHDAHEVLTVAEWAEGQGTATCVSCHETAAVPTTGRRQLQAIIDDGLFRSKADDGYCLACHGQPDRSFTFANGDEISLTIDASSLHDSVHGVANEWGPLACVDCHENGLFPHEPVTATSAREYSLEKYPVCADCHEEKYDQALDDVHGRALAEGTLEAAVCTDCHGAHDTPPPDEPRERISYTCEQCHSTIFDEYATSIHGEALLADSNPDVPTCIDCHGVHNIGDPTTAMFRIRSPQLCAGCHADEALMAEYDISTDVFDTYVADFHGTTWILFEHQDPDAETNKAVCYDCHSVHDIKAADDPEAGIKTNLLATCQQCHPNATENFPDAWTSHFRPSLQHNTLVFLVDWFYKLIIPGTVGFFGFLVATDVYRRLRNRYPRQTRSQS